MIKSINDERFFHQFKVHGTPTSSTCHQSYFRPYLSEVDGGTVYPCDSLVLNESCRQFDDIYAICPADKVLDFMDGNISLKFDARKTCSGCVFTENNTLLDNWKKNGSNRFNDFQEALIHEEFV